MEKDFIHKFEVSDIVESVSEEVSKSDVFIYVELRHRTRLIERQSSPPSLLNTQMT